MPARNAIARRAPRAVRRLLHPGEDVPHEKVCDGRPARIVLRKKSRDLGQRHLDDVLDLDVRGHFPPLVDLLCHQVEVALRPSHERGERAVPIAPEPSVVKIVGGLSDVPGDRTESFCPLAGNQSGRPRHDVLPPRSADAVSRRSSRSLFAVPRVRSGRAGSPRAPLFVKESSSDHARLLSSGSLDRQGRRYVKVRDSASTKDERPGWERIPPGRMSNDFAAPRNSTTRRSFSSGASAARGARRVSGPRLARRAGAGRARP